LAIWVIFYKKRAETVSFLCVNTHRLTGSFDIPYDIAASASELDEIVNLADQIGQVLKNWRLSKNSPCILRRFE